MRYHWGLGVGHVYSHKSSPSSINTSPCLPSPGNTGRVPPELHDPAPVHNQEDDTDGDDLEHCMMDRDADAWLDLGLQEENDSSSKDDDYDLERHEMYFDDDY